MTQFKCNGCARKTEFLWLDAIDMPDVAIALYIESGGNLAVVTARGGSRSLTVADNSILPVGVRRVNATGTTATDIHVMVIT